MDKNISTKIKALVADNQLEEALDLLIGMEQERGRERYNTLILLKGKLEMLEEQELADLLEFDDLAREKRKIAHALLNMTDEMSEGASIRGPIVTKQVSAQKTVSGNPAPVFKYLFFGLLLVAALVVAYNLTGDNDPATPPPGPADPTTEQKTTEPKTTEPTTTKKQEPENTPAPPTNRRTEQPRQVVEETRKPTQNPPEPTPEVAEPTPSQPRSNETADIRLSGFPNIGTTYSLGDTKFIFQSAGIRRSGQAGKLELTCTLEFICRTNFDSCTRPNIQLLVDDQPVSPTTHPRERDWIGSGDTARESLTFVFGADASNYRIRLEKHGSPWVRGFKILQ